MLLKALRGEVADLKKQLASADDVVRQLRLGRADLEEALAHQKAAAEEVWRFSHGFPLFSQHFPWFSSSFRGKSGCSSGHKV